MQSVSNIAESQLCTGCGVCQYMARGALRMIDTAEGRRPVRVGGSEADDGALEAAAGICPGASLTESVSGDATLSELHRDWGPVVEVWEGYAQDQALRLNASSGGASTALALYCLERRGFAGVLHTAARREAPYLNVTALSRTREELLTRTGSRYAPASPCDGLSLVENANAPCVFIGKPCDVAATQAARKLRPTLDSNLGLTIAFFCAGTPTTTGTLALLRHAGVPSPDRVESLRYRGRGWPGRWTVTFRDDDDQLQERSLSYEESWGFLSKYVQWRCRLCPDHTGEFADVAVGDPWYRSIQPGEPGKSLIVVRTRRGGEILRQAAAAGYIVLETCDASLLARSQPNLLRARGAVWGRILALRMAGLPVPRFSGFSLFRAWRRLSFSEKVKSIVGTWRRIGSRGLRRPQRVIPLDLQVSVPAAPVSTV